MAKSRSSEVPEGRALQYSDLDRTGQVALNQNMKERGKVKGKMEERVTQLKAAAANPANNATTVSKSTKGAARMEAIAGDVKNIPITLAGAAARRVEHFEGGVARSRNEGTGTGAGWYFEHHREIADSASRHGFPTETAITASAAMSPQNSPDNERAAVNALMGKMAGNEYNPKDLGRSGTKENLNKAEAHLAGGPDPLNPLGAPKVHSYREATKNAVPGSPTHDEYMGRVNHAAAVLSGEQIAGQGRLDLHGLAESREGILNPRGNTAEDTWMNSITYGQDLSKSVGRANVGKTIGSDKGLALDIGKKSPSGVTAHPAGSVGQSSLLHAYNNEATIRAAADVGQRTGVVDSNGASLLPSVAMQEVSWTEARRVANKDPEYNQANRAAQTTENRGSRTARIQSNAQGKLF